MTEFIKTFINKRGIFNVTLDGEVTQVGGDLISRPAEYVLSQFLGGNVHENLKVNA